MGHANTGEESAQEAGAIVGVGCGQRHPKRRRDEGRPHFAGSKTQRADRRSQTWLDFSGVSQSQPSVSRIGIAPADGECGGIQVIRATVIGGKHSALIFIPASKPLERYPALIGYLDPSAGVVESESLLTFENSPVILYLYDSHIIKCVD